jgi:ABC-type multidrug transport system ATPase subunit
MTMNLEPVHGVFMGLVVFGEVENNGSQLHFSKLWSVVNRIENENKNLFICEELVYHHSNGIRGLIDFNLEAQSGDLIALMGSSGSGKSTLLNILNGNYLPSHGKVLFNGVNVHEEWDLVRPYFGYVPQDDLLIEDLTVFENLYFSARLSVPNLTKSQISKKCVELLKEVGLYEVKDIKVGNALSKTISGGQRKRLNICLELIRSPQVLFMDEPTSGLSSRDSENIMNLLRRLSFKGTLIFVVIHQPSSTIYKLFDKLILLDTGGFPIYIGDPVEAVSYFKRCINHITSNVTTCPACGNINPEIIFDIVEGKVIDELGQETNERKTPPKTWFKRFLITVSDEPKKNIKSQRPPVVKNKNIFNQFLVFFKRDLLSKFYNTQFLLITLLEPLILSLLLSFVVRFYPFASATNFIYRFGENDNVPAFIFISIIVSIFMGLSLSAEEIFKDQKMQKREEFLSLSRFSYLSSKVSIQFLISFLQTIIFLLPSSLIIGNLNMFFYFFVILFSSACFGNILSLNISSAFKTIGTIYILIPILLIPQLILGGIIISYDKMNPLITNKDKVPVIADMIASRWAFEAACLVQFRDNDYDKIFYPIDKEISKWNYKTIYWIPQVENKIDEIESLYKKGDGVSSDIAFYKLSIIRNEIDKENQINGFKKFDIQSLSDTTVSYENLEKLRSHTLFLEQEYNKKLTSLRESKDNISEKIAYVNSYQYLDSLQKANHNKALEKLVLKRGDDDRIVEGEGELVQIVDPIYNDNYSQKYQMDCRSNFFSPVKYLFGIKFDTFWFNMGVIWVMCGALFASLHFNLLKSFISLKWVKKFTE